MSRMASGTETHSVMDVTTILNVAIVPEKKLWHGTCLLLSPRRIARLDLSGRGGQSSKRTPRRGNGDDTTQQLSSAGKSGPESWLDHTRTELCSFCASGDGPRADTQASRL